MPNVKKYMDDYFSFGRLKTKEVRVGSVVFGGENPVVVQSMTNTNTLDTQATVEQCIRIIKAGGELVRITVQGLPEAENLKNIKAEMFARGYDIPLAADIHFNPKAAEIAAQYVEKVRINPGNYAEKNTKSDFSEEEYQFAFNKTAEKLQALISICKKHKTAIRIGVNHGSLSSRILSKYGNTADGMVESALEFIKIFEDAKFYDLIISLKSSHVLTMVHANRMLAARMLQNKKVYPIHLGVTEAGNGFEGRQKSIAGIATLLSNGIGDTVRISLTEAPENEIPIAIMLRNSFEQIEYNNSAESVKKAWFDPFSYNRRVSLSIENIGGKNAPIVINTAAQSDSLKEQGLIQVFDSQNADYLYLGTDKPGFLSPDKNYIQDFEFWENNHPNCYPLLNYKKVLEIELPLEQVAFIQLTIEDLFSPESREALNKIPLAVLVLLAKSDNPVTEWREAFYKLHKEQINIPVVLHRKFDIDLVDTLLLEATKVYSALLLDGFGDGIWVHNVGGVHIDTLKYLSFGILQSCRLRLTQTDYIACPSCGRTLFNIEERLEEIRNKTNHLKHLKIAVMGCIVNGLGEMADADYGYVGSGIGKVNLYKGNKLRRKNLPEEDAAEVLIELIKAEGDWETH